MPTKARPIRSETKPATIRDVAKALGMSVATVSRTLAQPEKVRANTRRKVLKAVETLGYRPNHMAQNLARQETRLIFVVVPTFSTFFLEIMDGAEKAAEEEGYSVLLANTRGDLDRVQALFDKVTARRADGILLLTGFAPPSLKPANAVWPPTVVAAEPIGDPRATSVTVDHAAAARTAVRHLLELGHRRLAHITGVMRTLSSAARLRGVNEEIAAAGLSPDICTVVHGDFSVQSGETAMRELLKKKQRPTAVFAANDEMAIGAIRAIRAHGLRVPEDISVVGFDNNQHLLEVFDPTLTTINIPRFEIGYEAMKRLAAQIRQPSVPIEIRLPTQLLIRSTTTAPPRKARL
jgi:LacI family repressor for deo operon, udp, cdd, tsx, nupC, and nupG